MDGTRELVPEPYLQLFAEVPERHRKHSAGKVSDPAPPPEFWTHFNANNTNAKAVLMSPPDESEELDG